MTGPPATRPNYGPAPPAKRANHDIPVRLYDGALVAHVNEELAEELLRAGAAEAFRRGRRRYLRLRSGITIPRAERGWDLMEFLRRWHGDKRAAEYVAHKDRQSDLMIYEPPKKVLERPPVGRMK